MPTVVNITPADFDADDPQLALRRHTDRCFFSVEEVVPWSGRAAERSGESGLPGVSAAINSPGLSSELSGVRGFVVDGVMIGVEEVAELRRTDADGGPLPSCID